MENSRNRGVLAIECGSDACRIASDCWELFHADSCGTPTNAADVLYCTDSLGCRVPRSVRVAASGGDAHSSVVETALEQTRALAEGCHQMQGFVYLSSFDGTATDSALASIVGRLNDDYPRSASLGFTLFADADAGAGPASLVAQSALQQHLTANVALQLAPVHSLLNSFNGENKPQQMSSASAAVLGYDAAPLLTAPVTNMPTAHQYLARLLGDVTCHLRLGEEPGGHFQELSQFGVQMGVMEELNTLLVSSCPVEATKGTMMGAVLEGMQPQFFASSSSSTASAYFGHWMCLRSEQDVIGSNFIFATKEAKRVAVQNGLLSAAEWLPSSVLSICTQPASVGLGQLDGCPYRVTQLWNSMAVGGLFSDVLRHCASDAPVLQEGLDVGQEEWAEAKQHLQQVVQTYAEMSAEIDELSDGGDS